MYCCTLPRKDKNDDGVEDGGDEHEDGHDEAIDRLDKVKRTKPGAGIDNVAITGHQTPAYHSYLDAEGGEGYLSSSPLLSENSTNG